MLVLLSERCLSFRALGLGGLAFEPVFGWGSERHVSATCTRTAFHNSHGVLEGSWVVYKWGSTSHNIKICARLHGDLTHYPTCNP